MLLKSPSAILGTSMLERLGSSALSGATQILRGGRVVFVDGGRGEGVGLGGRGPVGESKGMGDWLDWWMGILE